jgi:hypothetical protein
MRSAYRHACHAIRYRMPVGSAFPRDGTGVHPEGREQAAPITTRRRHSCFISPLLEARNLMHKQQLRWIGGCTRWRGRTRLASA